MALKVLIVDDEEPARQGLTALLARWGYDVDEAADGQEAVSKAAQAVFQSRDIVRDFGDIV